MEVTTRVANLHELSTTYSLSVKYNPSTIPSNLKIHIKVLYGVMMVTKLGGGPVVNWAYFAIKKAPEEIKQRPIFMRAIFIWIYCRGLGDDLEILLKEVLENLST